MHSKYLIPGLACKADTLPSSTKGQQRHCAKLPPGATRQLARSPRAAPDWHKHSDRGPFHLPHDKGPRGDHSLALLRPTPPCSGTPVPAVRPQAELVPSVRFRLQAPPPCLPAPPQPRTQDDTAHHTLEWV